MNNTISDLTLDYIMEVHNARHTWRTMNLDHTIIHWAAWLDMNDLRNELVEINRGHRIPDVAGELPIDRAVRMTLLLVLTAVMGPEPVA